MKKKVTFKNGSSIFVDPSITKDFWDNTPEVTVTYMTDEEVNMTEKEMKLHNLQHDNLVGQIDAMWSDGYQDVIVDNLDDYPDVSDEFYDYMDEVARVECDFDTQY